MAYTGKKPVDHTDVTQSQSMTVTDDLTVDTNTLKVDSTNNRVGINLTSPDEALTVSGNIQIEDNDGYLQFKDSDGGTNNKIRRLYNSGQNLYISRRNDDNSLEANDLSILSDGKVGIGTISPAHELTVQNSTSDPVIRIHADTTSSPAPSIELMRGTDDTFGSDNYSDYRIKSASGHLTFEHGANSSTDERLRIDNSGGFLLNTTTKNANSQAAIKASSTIAIQTEPTSDGYYPLYFYNASGQQKGYIFTSSTATSYNTTSDYRLKENVVGITDGIERVKQLNPSRFNFIADADTTVDGFLAHEAATVVPESVIGEKDAVDADGNPDYQGIDQAKLVPLLTAALQEAITKIETLETKVAALETE